MPNRYTVKERDTLYKFIAARDGEYCLTCRALPTEEKPLQIDHANDDPTDWDPDNLHLACWRCNNEFKTMSTEDHIETVKYYSALNESERLRESGHPSGEMVKELVDYRSGSIEMQANSYFEKAYIRWIIRYIIEHGFISKQEAIDSGAQEVGCSTISAERYLRKLKAATLKAPLKEIRDATGTRIIVFK